MRVVVRRHRAYGGLEWPKWLLTWYCWARHLVLPSSAAAYAKLGQDLSRASQRQTIVRLSEHCHSYRFDFAINIPALLVSLHELAKQVEREVLQVRLT